MEFLKIEGLPFLIAERDLDKEMTYDEVTDFLSTADDGIRLPDNDELRLMFEYKKSIPKINKFDSYWSSQNSTEPDPTYGKLGTAYSMTMYSGIFLNGGRGKRDKCLVRLVK